MLKHFTYRVHNHKVLNKGKCMCEGKLWNPNIEWPAKPKLQQSSRGPLGISRHYNAKICLEHTFQHRKTVKCVN